MTPELHLIPDEKINHLELASEELVLLSEQQAKCFDAYYQATYGNSYWACRRGNSWIVRRQDLEACRISDISGAHWTTGVSVVLNPHADTSSVQPLLQASDYHSCLIGDHLFLIPIENQLVEQVEYRLMEPFFNRQLTKDDLERAASNGQEVGTIITVSMREFIIQPTPPSLSDLLALRAVGVINIPFFWRIVGHSPSHLDIQVTIADPREVLERFNKA